MERVIQDSDEDGESGSCAPLSSHNHSGVASPILATTHAQEDSLPLASVEADPGTSSTESLKRNIQAAHRDLVGSIPSAQASIPSDSGHNDNTGSGTQMTHSNKRRKTVMGMESSQSPGKKIERRKTGKTYGQSKQKRSGFSLEGNDSAFEALAVEEDQVSLIHCTHLSNAVPEPFLNITTNVIPDVTSTGVSAISWNLPGSMHDDFAQHEPFAMFPDLSSTVPDNTLTQQRLLDEALFNHSLDPVLGPTDPPHSSIPWSTFMTTPSKHTKSEAKMVEGSEHSHRDCIKEPGDSPNSGDAETSTTPNHPLTSTSRHSSQNILSSSIKASSSKMTQHSKTSRELISPSKNQDAFIDELSLPVSHLFSQRKKTSASPTAEGLPTLKKLKPKKNQKQDEQDCASDVDELTPEGYLSSISKDTPGFSRRKPIHSYDKDGIQLEVGIENSSHNKPGASEIVAPDDAIIDLPEERYKPRPSRSRSARVVEEEPIDYSIRPEKAAKLRARRSKTFGEPLGRVVLSSSEKLERIRTMGFSPSGARRALEEVNGDLDEAIEWLCNQPANRTQDSVSYTLSKEAGLRKSSNKVPVEKTTDAKKAADITSVRPSSQKQDLQSNEAQMLVESSQHSPKANSRGLLHVEIPTISNPSEKSIQIPRGTTTESELELSSEHFDRALAKTTIPRSNRTRFTQLEENSIQLLKEVEPLVHKSKRRKTTQLEDINKNHSLVHQSPAGPPKEKRGRGRPRLHPKPSEPTFDTHEVVEEAEDHPQHQQNTPANVLQRNGANRTLGSPLSRDKTMFAVTDEAPKPMNTPPESPEKRSPSSLKPTVSATDGVQTSQKVKEVSNRAHSPLSKGKVPFRVGLSKRARIAPLLRIMKK